MKTFRTFFPFAVLSLAAPAFFLAPDTGGGSGGGGDPAPAPDPAPETEENEPEPTGNTLEEKNASGKTIISQLFARLKATLGANTRMQQQFDALKQEAQNAKTEFTRIEGELKTEKDAHKLTSEKLVGSEKDVERLEGLCGLRGLKKDQVVPASDGSARSGEELYNEWESLKKTNPAKASAFRKQHAKALAAYAESQSTR